MPEPRPAEPSPPLPPAALSRLAGLAAEKRYPEMEALAGDFTASHPESGLAWKALSVAQQVQAKEALPALERAARLLPLDPEVHSNLGAALRQRGRVAEAIRCYRRALEIRPGIADVWANLGNALYDAGTLDEAVTAYSHALTLRPGAVKALNNLGNALKDLGQLDAALESYRRAIEADPLCTEAHVNLGSILRLQSRSAEAEDACRRALELDPHHMPALLLLADMQADRGQFGEAETSYRRAQILDPDAPEALAGLAGIKRMTSADSEWLAAAQRILAQPLAPRREVPLRYAAGKYHDDLGDHAEAFANYRRANALARQMGPGHDRDRVTDGSDRLIAQYGPAWVSRLRADANSSERPVFIVGMPRSGTTLAEQILASHGDVFGGGELPFWNSAVVRHAALSRDALESRNLGILADEYLAGLRTLNTDAVRVVDKMPGNFLYLGLIHAALPRAKFIHLRRNALDTCLSIYFQNFGGVHTYANDLGDLAHYYREYLRIMDHWRRLLPSAALLEVNYEDLVTAPEAASRQMLEFIGLSWDPRCLEFHRNPRTVSTFSKWQARQQINRGSIGRWRHYDTFIEPLRTLA